jgi:Family of unknown function (DUF6624)
VNGLPSSRIPGTPAVVGVIVIVALALTITVWRTRRVLAENEAEIEEQQRVERLSAELVEMLEAEQEVRKIFLGTQPDEQPRTPERQEALAAEAERLTQVQTVRVREIVEELGGWPVRSRVGAEASSAACVIAIHAYEDMAYMEWSLELMAPHVEARDLDMNCFAQLTDRNMMLQGLPQRYGTQFRYEEIDGVYYWGIADIEAPEQLFERRAELGLMDYTEYLDQAEHSYGVPDTVQPFPDQQVIPGFPWPERGTTAAYP